MPNDSPDITIEENDPFVTASVSFSRYDHTYKFRKVNETKIQPVTHRRGDKTHVLSLEEIPEVVSDTIESETNLSIGD